MEEVTLFPQWRQAVQDFIASAGLIASVARCLYAR